MKHLITLSSLALVAIGTLTGCRSTAYTAILPPIPESPARSLVILYDNDVHCAIEGYAKLAGYRDAVADTAYVHLVSNGDFLQGGTAGAISQGQFVVDVMKHVGYDAMTLGNHEFDYGMERMFELLNEMNAPVTSAILTKTDENTFPFPSSIIRTLGDKKVAYIGVTTPTTLYTEEYAFYDKQGHQLYNLSEGHTYELVQRAVDQTRAAGADYVIVLSHLGEDKNALNTDSHGLIAATTGIDALLDGHTHSAIPTTTVLNKDGKPVLVSQTGTKLANIGKLVITPDGTMTTELVPTRDMTRVNEATQHATDSVMEIFRAKTGRIVCQSETPLIILNDKGKQAVRVSETNAGDIVADAYRTITGADIAITNGGGIRTQLPAGDLTYGDIISLLPYENYVEVVETNGEQIAQILQACTRFLPVENGDFPQVSGIKYHVDGTKHAVTDIQVLNTKTGEYEPIKPEATYNLATIDYCVTGGGLQGLLKKNKVLRSNIMLYSEALIQYVTEHLNGHIGTEYAQPQGRITITY